MAPGTPTNVTASAGSTFANVSWTAPASTGSGIDHYTVTASPGGQMCMTPDGGTTSCAVTGLSNGTAYTFTVVANGTYGNDSAASAPSASKTPGPPGAPTNVTTTPGNASIRVDWTAPVNAGAGITRYNVTASPGGGTCLATGAATTHCTVNGLTSGTNYTFTVTATGLGGTSPASAASTPAAPGPPGTPTAPTATAGNASATVSWTAPGNVGGGIDHYTVTASGIGGQTCVTTDGTTTSCTVSGLANGTSYTFTVVANGVGTSGDSSASVATQAVTPGPSGAPTAVLVTAGNGSIDVSWTAPVNAGAGITGYTATASGGGNHTCTTGDQATTHCTISGLTGGTSYTVTVVANGPGGDSAASAASSPVTPGPAGAPTNVNATAGNQKITVSWSAPVNTGAGIDHYLATASPGGQTCATADNTTFTCDITGLTAGTSYTVSVVAVGGSGTGTSAASGTASAVPGPPGTPTAVSAVAGNTQATVSWTAPAGGGAIASYTVTGSPGGTCTTLDGSTTSCIVTGLSNGTAYTFTVRANGVGATGNSTASSASTAVTPGMAPGAPTAVVASAGTGQVTVSWQAPGNAGDGISGYTVTASPGGATCQTNDAAALSCAVTGLTAGTQYTFTVVARGVNGHDSVASAASTAVAPGPSTAPTGVVGVAGANSIAVSWTAPTNTGGGIATYTATAYLNNVDTGHSCTTADGTTTNCTITGLTSGTAYTVKVVANGAGGSGNSVASTASTAVTPGPPDAPTAVSGVAGNRQVTVSWTAPTNVGAGIARYTVTSNPGSFTCSTASASQTSCIVTGLTSGTAYTFTVIANGTGNSGDSAASTASTAVTPGPPDAPTSVSGVAGNRQVTVSWTAPANVGAGIARYTVSASPNGGGCITATASTTSCVVTGLTAGTPYTFTVVANGVGSSGDSAASTASAQVTPSGAPSAPTSVVAVGGDNKITVSWVASAQAGPGIARYTATANPGGAVCTTPNSAATSCTITDLNPGTSYTVTVVANGVGGVDSAASTASNSVMATAMLSRGPSIADGSGRQWAFALGTDQGVYANAQTAPGTWGTWTSLGRAFATAPNAIRTTDGRVMVFAAGTDGNLYLKLQRTTDGTTFGAWTNLGGTNVKPSSITLQVNTDGRIEIFGWGTDNAIWHAVETAANATTFSAWSTLGGTATSNPLVVRNSDGRLQVIIIGTDRGTYTATQTAAGATTYTAFTRLGTTTFGGINPGDQFVQVPATTTAATPSPRPSASTAGRR